MASWRNGHGGRNYRGAIVRRATAVALIIAFSALLSGQSNISQPTSVYIAPSAQRFTAGFNSIAATLTQIQAAPAAGQSLYITDIHIQTTTATSGTYAFQTGTGTNCGTGTAALFPSSGTGNRFNAPPNTAAMASLNFNTPLKLPAATALCVIGVATNTVSGQVSGYTAP